MLPISLTKKNLKFDVDLYSVLFTMIVLNKVIFFTEATLLVNNLRVCNVNLSINVAVAFLTSEVC